VIDEFGNRPGSIPVGTKTICRFFFGLLTLAYWKFNPANLRIANHSELLVDEVNTISPEVYAEIVNDIISAVASYTSSANTEAGRILAEPEKLKVAIMDKMQQPE
jgi:hypothetical protein